MFEHGFILQPHEWVGEGKIVLNMVEENLDFMTRWNVSSLDAGGKIQCVQEVQIKGLSEVMLNQFLFLELTPNTFMVELENQALGRVQGKGIINEQVIAWEFRVPELGFEGFEFYEKESTGGYLMRAEYASSEFRTLIQGRVWRPAPTPRGAT